MNQFSNQLERALGDMLQIQLGIKSSDYLSLVYRQLECLFRQTKAPLWHQIHEEEL